MCHKIALPKGMSFPWELNLVRKKEKGYNLERGKHRFKENSIIPCKRLGSSFSLDDSIESLGSH
jgi:hypothetical protein